MSHHNDIVSLLADIYASFASGDMSSWEDHLAEDALCIGTDEGEWMQGKDVIVPVMRAQLAEMGAAGITVTTGDVVAAEHGELLVVADRPTMHLQDGSTVMVRVTLAGRLVDGEVLIYQMHVSAPAPNEEVLQTELTVPS